MTFTELQVEITLKEQELAHVVEATKAVMVATSGRFRRWLIKEKFIVPDTPTIRLMMAQIDKMQEDLDNALSDECEQYRKILDISRK